ncbi:MAG: GUN4 domain-containing protein [Cyanobacteria bacterium P01_F01_bin.150]
MTEPNPHHQRLTHYRQRYIQALSQGIDLTPQLQQELDALQQQLDLSNDDVEEVKWSVKQGNLDLLPLPTNPYTLASSEWPSEVSPIDSTIENNISIPSSAPDLSPDSTYAMPPGALPLTSQAGQLIEESDELSSESMDMDGWGPSELTAPTLFDRSSDNEPTLLSTAPVVPTPLGSPPLIEPSFADNPPSMQDGLVKRIEQYETSFLAAIDRQFPVSERDRQALHQLQHSLDLSDNQVRLINQRIVDQVSQNEAYYHHTKIQDYAQQFVAFMEQEWPLSESHRTTLLQLQRQLELHDADVQVLEQQLVAQHQAKTIDPAPDGQALNMQASNGLDHLITELLSPAEDETNTAPSTLLQSPSNTDDGQPKDQVSAAQSLMTANESEMSEKDTIENSIPEAPAPIFAAAPAIVPGMAAVATMADGTEKDASLLSGKQDLLPTELESPEDTANSQAQASLNQGLASSSTGGTVAPEIQLLTERDINYEQLETLLRNKAWRDADEETLEVMRQATSRRVGWLDRQAILELPSTDLKTIDALWSKYSQGRFGFRVQQDIFKTTQASTSNVARFGQEVGWTIWQSTWIGFKYYKQLTFDVSAPPGHFPAKWFWIIPWWESVRSGGLGTGRGGCGGDASEMLTAMMLYKFLD